MKFTRIIAIILFIAIIAIPILTFNFEEDAVSAIDNRKLTANPLSLESLRANGLSGDNLYGYIRDRIGLRDKMILAYTVLNDRLFNKMVHPSYKYGTDGYVFGAGLTVDNPYTEFHEAYANMVKQIQDYCDARDIPFLFVFNPAKPAVLSEYVPEGMNYDRSWVDTFLKALDERQVRYIDNTTLLREKNEAGEIVFNKKYDANHWNNLGAYYGTTAILEQMHQYLPSIHVTSKDELNISQELMTSLPVSEFPIHEYVPSISLNTNVSLDKTALYTDELQLDSQFRSFGYYTNEARINEGAPRALVFQGSYMIGFGWKYLANAFSEYICIHDYQNIINFPYYYNVFQPDCVIFEAAEYTFSTTYYDYDKMCAMDLNPTLNSVLECAESIQEYSLEPDTLSIAQGNTLTVVHVDFDQLSDYAWLTLDREYDMQRDDTGFRVTIPTEIYHQYQSVLQITIANGHNITTFAS